MAIFQHEKQEYANATGQVEIKDIIESNIFSQLLHYIYSGRTTKYFGETALSVYTATDKYDIKELKEECVDYLIRSDMKNDGVDNATNMFVWGYLHSVSQVQDSALKFMAE